MSRFSLSLVLVLALVGLGRGLARGATVAILAPAAPSSPIAETMVRLQGELASVGFATMVVTDASVEALASRKDLDAVVRFDFPGTGEVPTSIQTWVFDQSHTRTLARSVSLPGPAAINPSTLAIRAIELLRSSFLELDWTKQPRDVASSPGSPAKGNAASEPGPAPRTHPFDLQIGGGVLFGPTGQPTTFVPLLRLGWLPRESWLVDLTSWGWGTNARLSTNAGTANLTQRYGGAGVWRVFRAGQAFEPIAGVAAGVLFTSAQGIPLSPNEGRAASQWSALFEARGGARLALGQQLVTELSAHALWAEPYPVVRFVGQDVATSGHPAFLLLLSLGVRL